MVHICDLHGIVYNVGGTTTPPSFLPSYSLCTSSPYVGGNCLQYCRWSRGSVAEPESHTKSGRVWLHETIPGGPCMCAIYRLVRLKIMQSSGSDIIITIKFAKVANYCIICIPQLTSACCFRRLLHDLAARKRPHHSNPFSPRQPCPRPGQLAKLKEKNGGNPSY